MLSSRPNTTTAFAVVVEIAQRRLDDAQQLIFHITQCVLWALEGC